MNILAIAVDTLRADHVSCYGYEYKTTPFLDEYATRGVRFENFYAPGIPTQPSFTTFYTGVHPITHQIVAHGGKVALDRKIPVFTEILQKAGYLTCAIDNLWKMKPWFTRGYEFYIDPSARREYGQTVDCDTQNSRAIPWLREHKRERFFLFVHYWDPHTPYIPPERYRGLFYQGKPFEPNNHSMDDFYKRAYGPAWAKSWFTRYVPDGHITNADFVKALYDEEIRYVDDGIKKLIGTLKEEGIEKETLVIIFSDHGESLTEHGIFFDHHGLYENNIHVPLIMVGPNVPRGRTIKQLVQHTDLAPTILEAAQVRIPESMEGKSLWPLISGEKNEPIYDKLITEESTRMCKWAMLKDNYKFILARESDYYNFPPRELYDLNSDPEEKNNLAEEKPSLARQYEEELEDWIEQRIRRLNRKLDPLKEQGASMPYWLGWIHPRKYW